MKHGRSTYVNYGCRCALCKRANTDYVNKRRRERYDEPTPAHVHGTVNGYTNYGCRCKACLRANRATKQAAAV